MLKSILASAGCLAFAFTSIAAAQEAGPSVAGPSVSYVDEVWAKPEDHELLARIYRPDTPSDEPLPVLISVHGGAWGAYDRTSGSLYDEYLASTGLLVVAIDFRQSPDFQHPKGSADVAAAVRWVRLNAEELNADPDQIGMIGSSSGGHLALLASIRHNHESHKGTPIAAPEGDMASQDDLSAQVDYVIAMWPVSSPITRYRYAQRAGIDQLVSLTERYFPTEDDMWDASVPRVVQAGEAEDLPHILVIQPGMDSNIPQDMTFDLIKAWQARGGELDYAFYPGKAHAFGHRPSPETDDMLELIASFIKRQTSD